MHKKIISIVIFIALIFALVQCTRQDNHKDVKEEIIAPEVIEPEISEDTEKSDQLNGNTLNALTIKKQIQITPIFLNTYEDIYIYYSMLKEEKDELMNKCIEFFLSIDTEHINQKGFSKYFGDLGRDLVKECQRFKMILVIGTGEKNLSRHFYRYHEFYVHNQNYYQLGKDLLEIEKSLDNSDYETALIYIKAVYENIVKIRGNENEGKDI